MTSPLSTRSRSPAGTGATVSRGSPSISRTTNSTRHSTSSPVSQPPRDRPSGSRSALTCTRSCSRTLMPSRDRRLPNRSGSPGAPRPFRGVAGRLELWCSCRGDPAGALGDDRAHGGRVAGWDPFAEPRGACLRGLAYQLAGVVWVRPACGSPSDDVEGLWAGPVGVGKVPARGHLLGGEWLLAVCGAARLGRRVEDGAIPAGRPAQGAGVGVGPADPDRDPWLLDRPGQAGDLAHLEVVAVVRERLSRPHPGQYLQSLIHDGGPRPDIGFLGERGVGEVEGVTDTDAQGQPSVGQVVERHGFAGQ